MYSRGKTLKLNQEKHLQFGIPLYMPIYHVIYLSRYLLFLLEPGKVQRVCELHTQSHPSVPSSHHPDFSG